MLNKLNKILKQNREFISLLVGVPSYDRYVEHMKSHHPGEPIKTQKEFFCQAQVDKYDAKDGKISRCC